MGLWVVRNEVQDYHLGALREGGAVRPELAGCWSSRFESSSRDGLN